MTKEQGKPGLLERGAGFMKRLNYFLGGAALAGALIAPPEFQAILVAFGVLQFAEGAVWKWLEKRRANKTQGGGLTSRPATAAAH
jgi:hypothetical protein